MTEGRRAFLERVAGIEGGTECERLAPLISLLADRELSAEELRLVRPHLKTCLACRARLREYRAAPERVAALVPPAALAVAGVGDPRPLRSLVEALIAATHDRAAALGERVQAATELATGQKLAAVAASTAAIAGGGATVDHLASPDEAPPRDQPAEVGPTDEQKRTQPSPDPPARAAPAPSGPSADPAPQPAIASPPEPAPPKPGPDPANEFSPAPAPTPAPAPAAASPALSSARSGDGFAPGGRGGDGGGSGGGEFGP